MYLPHLGLGPTVGLDSLGGGFFNFLKILPPFIKGREEGKSKQISGVGRRKGEYTAMSLTFFLYFLIGGFSYCPVSGLS